jgi:formamidopyrimidine-DNA glycosylase
MPELPDVELYREALTSRVLGRKLRNVTLKGPFVLRTAVPPLTALFGRTVQSVERIGKRIVLGFDGDYHLVVHLMIAGRLQWTPEGGKAPAKITLALFDFESGTLALTEAGTRKRASLHVVQGRAALAAHDPGGIDVMTASREDFEGRLRSENHTLKRSLTDPTLFSGIGNAYSDEILHRAKLSPLAMSQKISGDEVGRLLDATRDVLFEWTNRLREQAGGLFPAKVTAFHPEMAVHGKYKEPCPVCGAPVQRIVYAENEANYCARCQTKGVVLADRALSRVLHKSYRRTLDDDD